MPFYLCPQCGEEGHVNLGHDPDYIAAFEKKHPVDPKTGLHPMLCFECHKKSKENLEEKKET